MSGLAVALQESARAQPLTQKSGCIFPFPSQETLHNLFAWTPTEQLLYICTYATCCCIRFGSFIFLFIVLIIVFNLVSETYSWAYQ